MRRLWRVFVRSSATNPGLPSATWPYISWITMNIHQIDCAPTYYGIAAVLLPNVVMSLVNVSF
jgi:hypothetical protein